MDSFHFPVKSQGSDSSTSITALAVSLVPATAPLSIKGVCVHVPQVPSAGLWGHPQVSQDGTLGIIQCWIVSLDSLYLLPSSLLYPMAKGYFPETG